MDVAASESQDGPSSHARMRLSTPPRDDSGPSTPADYGGTNRGSTGSPPQSYSLEGGRSRHHSSSKLANSMMRTVVSSGNDALNILFEAAAAHSQENDRDDQAPRSQLPPHSSEENGTSDREQRSMTGVEVVPKVIYPVELSDASREVLNVWEGCRFVKMGWFTAREAVTYIDQ